MTVGLSKHPLTFAAAVSGSLGADLVSDSIDIGDAQVVTTAIQLAWTGTPTGTAYVEESIDGVNWSQLATVALAGSASSAILDVTSVAISLRVRYSRASSTGTLTGMYYARVGGSLAGAAGGGTASHVVVDSGTLSLPSGASTSAKQPALGTAGSASADVLSVQGIAGGTAIPVSNASLPLPTGAATAAKQPALGTAGSAATDVITVQGIASGTPVPVTQTAPTAGAAAQFTVTTAGTAVQGAAQACTEVEVCCHLESPGNLCVGFATGDLRAANSIKVYQGQSIKIKISNVNKLWFDASASASLGSWLAT